MAGRQEKEGELPFPTNSMHLCIVHILYRMHTLSRFYFLSLIEHPVEKPHSTLFIVGSLISFLAVLWPRTFSRVLNDVLMMLPILSTNVYNYISLLSKET